MTIEEAIKDIKENIQPSVGGKSLDIAIEALKQSEQKKGKWIGVEADGYADGSLAYDVWECSECGYEHEGEDNTLTPYCPMCGAKMDEG